MWGLPVETTQGQHRPAHLRPFGRATDRRPTVCRADLVGDVAAAASGATDQQIV